MSVKDKKATEFQWKDGRLRRSFFVRSGGHCNCGNFADHATTPSFLGIGPAVAFKNFAASFGGLPAMSQSTIIERYMDELVTEKRKLEMSIYQLRDKVSLVDAKIEAAKELKQRLVPADPSAPAAGGRIGHFLQDFCEGDRVGATEAIVGLLQHCPEGLSRDEIVSGIGDCITTASTDKRRLILNTILHLSRRGRVSVVDDSNGRDRVVLTR